MSFIQWEESYSVKHQRGLKHRVRAIDVRRAFDNRDPCGGRDNGKYLDLGDSFSKCSYQVSGAVNVCNNCVFYERDTGKIVETKGFSRGDAIIKESVSSFTEEGAKNLKVR